MANHLQALALLAAISVPGWGAAPFSHKLHLKLKPQCVSCHAAAATSTKVSDNLIPAASSCQPCHKDAPPRKQPRATNLAHFSHQQHIAIPGIAKILASAIDRKTYLGKAGDMKRWLDSAKQNCEACHRGLAESESVSEAAFPVMADCVVCHSNIEPPFTCEKCHAGNAPLKPPNHVEGFMSSHARPDARLDKTTCAVCHGKTFTCLGCHQK